ncbi:CHAT domain-containing protein [Caulobacter vibrioides]|uniref:CHAT domain-containing protein n=1 Tax=Caulobacter vibrioides TaxID=155892 RepID=A0A290MJI6_CAUVI|nr:CHAT domain-containing protein [Caulobacter vibrioides]ATC32179.1 CHAT domain-containing protein [Caulobacter vibrioides]
MHWGLSSSFAGRVLATVCLIWAGFSPGVRAQTATLAAPEPLAVCNFRAASTACQAARTCLEAPSSPACKALLRDEAFEAAQLAGNETDARIAAQLAARSAAADHNPALGGRVRERQDLEAQRSDLQRDIVAAAASADPSDLETLRVRLTSVDQRIAALGGEIARLFPDYARLADPSPLSVAEARNLLGDDEALFVLTSTPAAVFVWVVTAQAVDWRRVPIGSQALTAAIAKLRAPLDPEQPGRFDRRAAFDLYTQLLAPFAPVAGKKSHWIFATSGPLLALPLGVLVASPPKGQDRDYAALRDTSWLATQHALSVLPSTASLRALRCAIRDAAGRCTSAPARARSRKLAGFGAPTLLGDAATYRGGPCKRSRASDPRWEGDQSALETLCPLPAAGDELREIARTVGAPETSLRLGPQATEASVRDAPLDDVEIIAFATHGLQPGQVRTEAGLVLTPPRLQAPPAKPSQTDDGYLAASEIAQLKFNAEWTILSACNTGYDGAAPEGLSSLTRAFIYAGSRSLLVSQWTVDDIAAARLTSGAIQALRDRRAATPALALKLAMQALITDPSDPRLAHPALWAPFALVGEGRLTLSADR